MAVGIGRAGASRRASLASPRTGLRAGAGREGEERGVTVNLVDGRADDLDSVMRIMSEAFPDRYGEAWTRSQCAGILPMTGVSLTLAEEADSEIVGFSLYRTIADDSELLLLAVSPRAQSRGVGRRLL